MSGARKPSAIPFNTYTPWFNQVNLGGIVASAPFLKQWTRPSSGLRMYGMHFLMFSRLLGSLGQDRYEKHYMVPVTYLSTVPKYAPLLRVGQVVLVNGELLSYFSKRDGRSHVVVRCRTKPTLLWGRSGKFGTPEELRPFVDEGVVGGEDFAQDVLKLFGDLQFTSGEN